MQVMLSLVNWDSRGYQISYLDKQDLKETKKGLELRLLECKIVANKNFKLKINIILQKHKAEI